MYRFSTVVSFKDHIYDVIIKYITIFSHIFLETNICNRPNQIYSGCGDNGCQRSCDRLDTTNCIPRCGNPACICVNGFVKNSFGDCVTASSCR